MILNYELFSDDVAAVVRSIEKKPHVRYIRYLIVKMVSPWAIKNELKRLALSSPEKHEMNVYFSAVIDPVIEKHRLGKYYKQYKANLAGRDPDVNFGGGVMNFHQTFKDDVDGRKRFCALIRELEIEEMWSNEVVRFYGGIHNLPVDLEGTRIIKTDVTRKSLEKILLNPKRYLVDKHLIEGLPMEKVAKSLREGYGLDINGPDLSAYQRYFFNYKRRSVEEMVESLQFEKKCLKSELEIIDRDDSLSIGEVLAMRSQMQDRIDFLENTERELVVCYQESAYGQVVMEEIDLANVFKDITLRGYQRFKHLDSSKDRDVVGPLTALAKMMGYTAEKFKMLENPNKQGGTPLIQDKHTAATSIGLVSQRYEEMQAEAEAAALGTSELEVSEIEGIDEL